MSVNRVALRQIYRDIPALDCKGLCSHCCGPIAMAGVEADRMREASGGDLGTVDLDTLRCPLLDENERCTVYHVRPLICRLWGNVEDLKCEHGCKPKRYLTGDEARDLLDRMTKLDPTLESTLPDPPYGFLHALGVVVDDEPT